MHVVGLSLSNVLHHSICSSRMHVREDLKHRHKITLGKRLYNLLIHVSLNSIYRLSQQWYLWFGAARRRSRRRRQQHGGAANNKPPVVVAVASRPTAFGGRHGGVAIPDCQRPRACCRRWPWRPPAAKRRRCRTRGGGWCSGGSQQGEASKHGREVPQWRRGMYWIFFS